MMDAFIVLFAIALYALVVYVIEVKILKVDPFRDPWDDIDITRK